MPCLLGRLANFPNREKKETIFWKLVKIYRNVSTHCLCTLLRTPMAGQDLVHFSRLIWVLKNLQPQIFVLNFRGLHLLAFPMTDSSWKLLPIAVIPAPGHWVKPQGCGARSWDDHGCLGMTCVTLGMFLDQSGPGLTHLGNRDDSIGYAYLRRHQKDPGSWTLQGFPREGLGAPREMDGKAQGGLVCSN